MKYYLIAILITLFCFSCWENEHKSYKDESNNNNSSHVDETLTMEEGTAVGCVKDPDGKPLAGVTVSTGTKSIETNNAGLFHLDQIGVINKRAVFKFTKDGYFSIVRSNIKEDENSLEVTLYPKGNHKNSCEATFSASSGKQLNAGGMLVKLEASSVMVESTGKPYSGTVKADVLYMDPNNENFATMMPGSDMAAIRSDKSETILYSYGMVNVNLTADDGTPLQLQEGKKSTLSFPIPEGMENNPPQTMPLWHFNDKTGIWVESGEATLEGDKYVGEVGHFSVVNADVPAKYRATLTIKIVDEDNNPVPYLPVQIAQIEAKTSENGTITRYVDANSPVTVKIRSIDYGYGIGSSEQGEYIFSKKIPAIGGNKSRTETITLPNTYTVKGEVVNECSSFSTADVSLGNVSDLPFIISYQQTGTDGKFCLRVAKEFAGSWLLAINTGDTIVGQDVYVDRNIDLGKIPVCSDKGGGVRIKIFFAARYLDFFYDANTEVDGAYITDNTLAFLSSDENTFLFINNYSPSQTSYNDAELYFYSEQASGEYDGKADITINPVDRDFLKIQLTSGIGDFYDYITKKNYDARIISGEISIPVIARGTKKYNVTSLNGADIPKFIEVPTPIDLLIQSTESTLWNKSGSLFYKDRNLTDYEQLKKVIEKTDFREVYKDENSSAKSIAYQSGDNYILLDFSSGIYSMWEGEETAYHLSIEMIQGCKIDILRWYYSGEMETNTKAAAKHKTATPFMKSQRHR